ncbi:hypothetical protein F4810DRAFT_667039 [Camillea tinctor]|nr:hypothetical protein F4810DRAFT_667039 [Camillea tinctor]
MAATDDLIIASTPWNYIFVGGGLSASVVAHPLYQLGSNHKILIIEAGPDANRQIDILYPNSTNTQLVVILTC